MVGAIASGPMYFSTRPTRPEKPRTIWSREDTRMAPWICGQQVKQDATQTHKTFLCTQLNIAATRKIKTYEKKCEENTFSHHKSTTTDGFVILVKQILFCACGSGTLEHSFFFFFFFIVLFDPTVSLLFQHGSFSEQSSKHSLLMSPYGLTNLFELVSPFVFVCELECCC